MLPSLRRRSEPTDESRALGSSIPPLPAVGTVEPRGRAVALNYFAYNVIKIHTTLRVPPAMAPGSRWAC